MMYQFCTAIPEWGTRAPPSFFVCLYRSSLGRCSVVFVATIPSTCSASRHIENLARVQYMDKSGAILIKIGLALASHTYLLIFGSPRIHSWIIPDQVISVL